MGNWSHKRWKGGYWFLAYLRITYHGDEQCFSFEGFIPHLLSDGSLVGNAEAWSVGQSWGEEMGHSTGTHAHSDGPKQYCGSYGCGHAYVLLTPDSNNQNIWMYKIEVNCQIWIVA